MSVRLLWVDNSTLETESYREQLSGDYKVEIDIAHTPDQALEALAAHRDYRAVVLNPWLAPGEGYVPPQGWQDDPNSVGLDLIRRVHDHSPATPIVPIIMGGLTAAGQFDYDQSRTGLLYESSVPLLDYLPSDFSRMMKPYLRESPDVQP